jgi:hypothetical protein
LQLEDVSNVLQTDAPGLLASLLQRKDDLAVLSSSGWETAVGGSQRHQLAAAAGSANVLQHWVQGDPESDWHFRQQVLQAQEEEALRQRMQEEGLVDEQGRPWFDFGQAGFWGGLHQAAGRVAGLMVVSWVLKAVL